MEIYIYFVEELKDIIVFYLFEKVFEVIGVYGVVESIVLKSSGEGIFVLEK